ncbi:cell division protein CrgA [Cellulomonas endophytica]|uniref:cell division protein CrgA n=1 Tax=Cellulomonas endophytica TaxID=2494735 RepID=UPI0010127541|nr:cell division protein CrgA [Cellulomonas endophytica]
MPESRSRKKPAYTPPTAASSAPKPNPVWWVPVMLGLMVLGLLWVVTTYMSSTSFPIPGIGSWNLAVGFGLMLVGFVMTMRWR